MRLMVLSALGAAVLVVALAIPGRAPAPAPAEPPATARWEAGELRHDRARTPPLRWTAGSHRLEAATWAALGDELRAPPAQPSTGDQARVLARLAALGWELVGQPAEKKGAVTWTFRRRVP